MKWKLLIVLLSLTIGLWACGGGSQEEGKQEEQKTEQTETTNQEQTQEQQEATEAQDTTQSAAEGESTEAVAEAKYQCPMKCEGDKVYDKPGKCPKCGMDLEPVQ